MKKVTLRFAGNLSLLKLFCYFGNYRIKFLNSKQLYPSTCISISLFYSKKNRSYFKRYEYIYSMLINHSNELQKEYKLHAWHAWHCKKVIGLLMHWLHILNSCQSQLGNTDLQSSKVAIDEYVFLLPYSFKGA